ncbi:MAG: hypothetical protein H7144_05365 [Burkholderiales bacterium]|nr:hypothetical protein [Phycisphaerae bacterium]
MQRVAVVGSPGAGKSTLAVELGRRTELPVFHLDRMFWRPGWTPTSREEFRLTQERLVRTERWVIDGNYDSTLPIRMAAADTIIFLDLPTWICLARVIRRSLSRAERNDMGEGCPERIFSKDFREFLLWVLNFHRIKRPRMFKLLNEFGRGKAIYHLRSSSAVTAFLQDHV